MNTKKGISGNLLKNPLNTHTFRKQKKNLKNRGHFWCFNKKHFLKIHGLRNFFLLTNFPNLSIGISQYAILPHHIKKSSNYLEK